MKNRPVAVVVALQDRDGAAPKLFIAPVTTQPPRDPDAAIEVPDRLKRPAGLDAARCWVFLNELNI
ncbi:MAG: growth inhibitor PemK, partial [Pseudomonadota bacterium]